MTTLYVSTSGSNTAPYDTLAKGANILKTAFAALTGTGDDVVIMDDEDHVQDSDASTHTGSKTAGTITLRSLSEDNSLCFISGNTTAGNFYLTRSAEKQATPVPLSIENITYRNNKRTDGNPHIFDSSGAGLTLINVILDNIVTVGTDAVDTGFIRVADLGDLTIDDLTIRNCSWAGNRVTASAPSGGNEGVVFSSQNWGGTGTFSGITIESLTVTFTAGYQLNGIFFFRGTNNWSGTNSFSGLTITGSQGSYGLIKMESSTGGYLHTIAGIMTISGVNQTLTTSNGDSFGYINVSADDTLTISANMAISDCTSIVDAGESDNGVIASVFSTSNLVITDDANISLTGNSFNSSVSATGLISNKGKDATIKKVTASGNSASKGIIYVVSQAGDTDVSGCYLHDNIIDSGGGIYSYPVSGINNITISNCTITDNTVSGTGHGMILNNATGNTDTYTVQNVICRNGGTDEISCAGTGDPAVTVDYSNIEGGVGATTGIDTYGANNIDSDDTLVNGVPVAGSASLGIGARWWTGPNPRGANGEPFSDFDTDIGANASTHGPFHPVNL